MSLAAVLFPGLMSVTVKLDYIIKQCKSKILHFLNVCCDSTGSQQFFRQGNGFEAAIAVARKPFFKS